VVLAVHFQTTALLEALVAVEQTAGQAHPAVLAFLVKVTLVVVALFMTLLAVVVVRGLLEKPQELMELVMAAMVEMG
jgi:hypothetical protein